MKSNTIYYTINRVKNSTTNFFKTSVDRTAKLDSLSFNEFFFCNLIRHNTTQKQFNNSGKLHSHYKSQYILQINLLLGLVHQKKQKHLVDIKGQMRRTRAFGSTAIIGKMNHKQGVWKNHSLKVLTSSCWMDQAAGHCCD